jgi:hypothetical protein
MQATAIKVKTVSLCATEKAMILLIISHRLGAC